jgi:hypothetical protein
MAAPTSYLGSRLRYALTLFHRAFDDSAQWYPEVSAALGALEAAVEADIPRWAKRRKRPVGPPKRNRDNKQLLIKRLQNRFNWMRKSRDKAFERVGQLVTAKAAKKHNRMALAFLAKVALSWPALSVRGFARIVGQTSLA